jgi:hypothetical protein
MIFFILRLSCITFASPLGVSCSFTYRTSSDSKTLFPFTRWAATKVSTELATRDLVPFHLSDLIVQVPRRFASITSGKRLQDNFRVATTHPESHLSLPTPFEGTGAGALDPLTAAANHPTLA